MTELAAIQEQLLATAAALAVVEQGIAEQPTDKSLPWSARSLAKRMRRLEAELNAAAATRRREVCRYRIIPEHDRLRIADIGAVLKDYQLLVTVFYAAVKEGAKSNTNVSVAASEETAMEFSYAAAGSAIFAFTSRAEADLFDRSDLDAAVDTIAQVSAAKDSEQVLRHARRLGAAPIRVLYRWADEHLRGGFSADIEWVRGDEVKSRLLIQMPEFARLCQAITETSDEEVSDIEVMGELRGADVESRSFHFVTDERTDIKGHSGNVIGAARSVQLPGRYTIRVRQTTKVQFATEKTTHTYELLSLEPG